MDKKDFKKLALLGLAGGVVLASQGTVQANQGTLSDNQGVVLAAGCGAKGCNNETGIKPSRAGKNFIADADEAAKADAGQLMTEDQLMSQLNDQGKQQYKSLTPEGKAMAIKLASRSCKGTNDCKGQNSCKADDHSCAGKGSCAGSSQCSFKDKNTAVKVAAQLQSEKRAKTDSGSY